MPAQHDRSLQHRLQWLVIALGLAAAFPTTGADVVFYENDGFRGRSFVADQSISNFANVGFNDRASSVVIHSGTWQLCSDAFFRGRCVTLAPGEYPTLRSMALDYQISSARNLDWLGSGGGATKPGGRVELFSGDRFEGRVFVVNGAVTNLPNDFNDRARSMVVYDGHWEVCEDIDYRGTCQTYGPGRYANLGGMANRISSLRPGAGPGPGPAPGPSTGARVDLFDGARFAGRVYPVAGALANFGNDFNDRAQSMIVYDGYWEVCEDVDFRGTCQVYGGGRYPSLGAMSSRASSIRPVAGPGPGLGAGGWGTGARAMLYEGPNLSGRTYVLDAEVLPNLDRAGFNDRASSLRVEGGYWLFCSDINFNGDCLTFGPGDYPTLPWSLNNRISSGRRIGNQYPYNQNPNWPR
jgi:hypothetical protein